MIKEILNNITSEIPYFDTIPLTEEIDGKRMTYLGRSEYKEVNIEKGGAFYVMTDMDQEREEGITCVEDVVRTYRLDLHVNIKRKDLECDDEFAYDTVSNDIIGRITGRNRVLAKTLGIRYIDTFVDEVSNDGGFMSKHYLFIRLSLVIETRFTADCLTALCS